MGGYRQLPITPFEPQQSNPLQMLAGIQQLKNAQQNNVALQQENQQRALALQDQQAMTAAMHEWDGKDLNALTPLMVKHGASANAVIGLKGKVLEQQEKYSTIAKNDAETGAKNLETMKAKNDAIVGGINALKDVPDEQLAQSLTSTVQDLTTKGLLSQQEAQQGASLAQSSDPKQMRKGLDLFAKLHMTASQQMEQAAKQAETFKNTQQGNEAQAQTTKIQQETQFGPTGPAAEAKYRSILGKLNAGQEVPDADIQFAKGMELSNTKTTTQSDTLGVTSTNTSRPSGLAAARARFNAARGVPAPAAGGGSAQPAASSAKDSIVDMVGQYKLNPTMLQRMVVKHPDVIAAVNQKYPDWDQTTYNAKNKMLLSYTSGPESKSINAINTALGHAGELGEAIKALDNGDVGLKTLRAIGNRLGVEVGGDAVTTFNTIVHRIAPEISAAYVQGGGTGAERGSDAKDFDASLGGSQLRNNLAETVKLLRSKIGAQENQWNTTFQPKKDSDQFQNRFITPAAKATLDEWSAKAPTNSAKFQVGQSVSIRGKQMKVTAVHPDGSFDAQ